MKVAIVLGIASILTLSAAFSGIAHAQELFWVNGTDMGPVYNHVQVWGDSDPVSDAVVTVNGHTLSNGGSGGTYSGQLSPAASAGEILNLVVEIGDDTITAVGAVPEPPILTSPLEGELFGAGGTILVQWTSSTNPDRFQVNIDAGGSGQRLHVEGSARSLEISTAEFEPGTPIQISVFSYTDGVFTGPVSGSPSMNIRGTSWETVTITVPVEERSWARLKAQYR